jgi:hypothetical protein
MKRGFLVALLLLLSVFLASQVYAYTYYGDAGASPPITEADFIVAPDDYSGVGELTTTFPTGSGRNTATLLPGGEYILTAAHSATGTGNSSAPAGTTYSITFEHSSLPGGSWTESATVSWIPLGWTGGTGTGLDIAVLKLNSVAPAVIDRYDIYRPADAAITPEIGQDGIKVGYGRTGDGSAGYGGFATGGTKRAGENLYDTLADTFLNVFSPGAVIQANAQLGYDFDGVDAAGAPVDPFGFWDGQPWAWSGLADAGLGPGFEVFMAPGDSGGPTFLPDPGGSGDLLIAGVTSFSGRLVDLGGNTPDIDGIANSSFGEFAGDTMVSFYAAMIDEILNGGNGPQVPEPGTMLLLGTGLIGLAAFRRKFKN